MMSYENMFSPLNPFDTVSYLLALKVWGDYASNLLSTGLTKVSQFLLANLGYVFRSLTKTNLIGFLCSITAQNIFVGFPPRRRVEYKEA